MNTRTPVRAALRAETADMHDRVDAAFSGADLTDRAGYARFLTAQAAAHLPVEAALTRDGAERIVPDWDARRRAPALESDLAALDLPVPDGVDVPVFGGFAAILGGIYVLEGSRLGGGMLVRAVPPDLPRAFLGAGNSLLWRGLLSLLEDRLRAPADLKIAIASAREVFGLFETAGRRLGGVIRS